MLKKLTRILNYSSWLTLLGIPYGYALYAVLVLRDKNIFEHDPKEFSQFYDTFSVISVLGAFLPIIGLLLLPINYIFHLKIKPWVFISMVTPLVLSYVANRYSGYYFWFFD